MFHEASVVGLSQQKFRPSSTCRREDQVSSVLSYQSRRDLVRQMAPRYQEASRARKSVLLDEFVALTGYMRKYAIQLLNHPQERTYRHNANRRPDGEVRTGKEMAVDAISDQEVEDDDIEQAREQARRVGVATNSPIQVNRQIGSSSTSRCSVFEHGKALRALYRVVSDRFRCYHIERHMKRDEQHYVKHSTRADGFCRDKRHHPAS